MTAYKHNVAARKAAKEKGESHFDVEMYASEQDALKHTKAMEKSSMDIENTVAAMLRRIAAYRRNDETAQRYRGWYFRNGNIIQSNENQNLVHGPFQAAAMKEKLNKREINKNTLVCYGEPGLWFEVRHLFPPSENEAFELDLESYKSDVLMCKSYVRFTAHQANLQGDACGV